MVLSPSSRLTKMYGIDHKIAISLLYRGPIQPYEVHTALKKVKTSIHPNCFFEGWSPLGFKIAVNNNSSVPLISSQEGSTVNSLSCCSLTNSFEFKYFLEPIGNKFDGLYYKRAFVWSFIQDCFEEGSLTEGR
jgi:hypothetical protein